MNTRDLLIALAVLTALILVVSAPALSQVRNSDYQPSFEIGGGAGGSFYQAKTIRSGNASAKASFENFISASAWLGHDMYQKIGGEVHYDYAQNEMKLASGATTAKFGGRSHAIHYDVMFYGTKRAANVRPYFFAGGGFKLFQGTGTPTAFQGLNSVAVLTEADELKPMVSFGGGVKFRVHKRAWLRAEFRDNLSQFPTKVITPIDGSDQGWLHNFLILFGISCIF